MLSTCTVDKGGAQVSETRSRPSGIDHHLSCAKHHTPIQWDGWAERYICPRCCSQCRFTSTKVCTCGCCDGRDGNDMAHSYLDLSRLGLFFDGKGRLVRVNRPGFSRQSNTRALARRYVGSFPRALRDSWWIARSHRKRRRSTSALAREGPRAVGRLLSVLEKVSR